MKTSDKFIASACLLGVLCLASCNKLEEGDVVEKWYEPARTYVAVMPMTILTGKSTTTIMVPYVVTDNEDWCVKIKGKYKGEERVEIVYISQKQYECVRTGSHLKLTDDCSTSDDNNHKERQ